MKSKEKILLDIMLKQKFVDKTKLYADEQSVIAILKAMQEYANQEAEKAFNAGREGDMNVHASRLGVDKYNKFKFKDYKHYLNSKEV